MGDRIKLSTDGLRDAAASAAYRKDVRLLGNLWQQALMSASPKSSEIAAHAADPNPQTRWTLAEINAALHVPLPAVPPPVERPIAATPLPAPPTPVAPASDAPVAVRSIHRPRRQAVPSRQPRRIAEHATINRFPKWIFVGAAGVLLLIVGSESAAHRRRRLPIASCFRLDPPAEARARARARAKGCGV